jgi:hypothetical protein
VLIDKAWAGTTGSSDRRRRRQRRRFKHQVHYGQSIRRELFEEIDTCGGRFICDAREDNGEGGGLEVVERRTTEKRQFRKRYNR